MAATRTPIPIEELRNEIRGIVISNQNKASAKVINDDYRSNNGKDIPYETFGHYTLDNFLSSHHFFNVLVSERDLRGNKIFKACPDSKTGHIIKLVAGQKQEKSRFRDTNHNWRAQCVQATTPRTRIEPPRQPLSSTLSRRGPPNVSQPSRVAQATSSSLPNGSASMSNAFRPNGFSHSVKVTSIDVSKNGVHRDLPSWDEWTNESVTSSRATKEEPPLIDPLDHLTVLTSPAVKDLMHSPALATKPLESLTKSFERLDLSNTENIPLPAVPAYLSDLEPVFRVSSELTIDAKPVESSHQDTYHAFYNDFEKRLSQNSVKAMITLHLEPAEECVYPSNMQWMYV